VSAARVRIGKVRLKNGPVIVRLPSPGDRRRKEIEEIFRRALDDHGEEIAGFALVVWDNQLNSIASMKNSNQIPGSLVPDYVRNRLLAEKIIDWAVERIAANQ
jgi:hypothetical protein